MRRTLIAAALALVLGACSDDSNPIKPDQSTIRDLPGLADLIREAAVGEASSPREARAGDLPRTGDGAKPDAAKGDLAKGDATATPDGPATCGKLRCNCTIYSTKQGKLINLWGTAKDAGSGFGADFKVKVVTFNPQLKVKTNTTFATKCGEWQTTTSGFPTFTYQIVTFGEDFTIQYDNIFPGLNTVACPNCK